MAKKEQPTEVVEETTQETQAEATPFVAVGSADEQAALKRHNAQQALCGFQSL